MKEIRITRGQIALVDDNDFDSLSKYRWYCLVQGKQRYAVRCETKTGRKISMHREIMGFPNSLIDHINRNGLDNRRSNLRLASKSENARNSHRSRTAKSGYRGVYFYKHGNPKKWNARIMINCQEISLGYFKTPEEGAIAYNSAAQKYHGEFAVLNEIKKEIK